MKGCSRNWRWPKVNQGILNPDWLVNHILSLVNFYGKKNPLNMACSIQPTLYMDALIKDQRKTIKRKWKKPTTKITTKIFKSFFDSQPR